MAPILVAGLINYETTLTVEEFPIAYAPVRYPFFGVNGSISGVGYNIAMALHALGHTPRLLSLVGADASATMARTTLMQAGLSSDYIRSELERTCQSVILYDPSGRRAIFTDLKDIQERSYPAEAFTAAAAGCRIAVLCNINFTRPLLAAARAADVPIATDVHALSDLNDPYNSDYMAAATVLFISHERLPEAPADFARAVQARHGTPVIVVGMGAAGALLCADGEIAHVAAVTPRPIVNTVGAGDALFAAFVAGYAEGRTPRQALDRAVVFAGYKIGANGGAAGFPSAATLDELLS